MVVKQPNFAQVKYMDYDQLRYVDYFDTLGNRMFPSESNYLSGVDSCAAYVVYNVKSSYHPITVLSDHPHKLLASYKRVNDTSWFCYQSKRISLLIEDRQKITSRDTVHKENLLNPGEIVQVVTEYYDVSIK